MSSLAKFSKRIAEKWAEYSPERLAAISKLDPRRIYVENVRVALGTPTWVARMVCETAVRQGIFVKHVQALCPSGAVGASAPTIEELPPTTPCWIDVDGDRERVELPTTDLVKMEFYKVAGSDATAHA